jgi:hypothetical protein
VDPARLELSLQEIEGDDWGDPDPNAAGFIQRCRRLRRVPIGSLEPGDLRQLLAQGIGVEALVPLALTLLEQNPELDSELYEGDLLTAVWAGVPESYWTRHPDEFGRFKPMIPIVAPGARFEPGNEL